MHRPIYEITREILRDWKRPSPAAAPYLDAMLTINKIGEDYGAETADTVVMYFLSNAQTWRGNVAKKIKVELNEMLKDHGV